jgi:hypothetical protein
VGRPKKSPDQVRDRRAAIMLTDIERAELEQRADAFGVSLSEYVRRQSLGRAMPARVADDRTRAALATALLRLGVNLNQIARHMNAGRFAPPHLGELIEDIRSHVAQLTSHEPRQDRAG